MDDTKVTTEQAIAWFEYRVKTTPMAGARSMFEVALSALRTQQEKKPSGWIGVKDMLPDRFQPVIICREKARGEHIVEQGMRDVGDWWKVHGTRTKKVLYWMPMPWPPREL